MMKNTNNGYRNQYGAPILQNRNHNKMALILTLIYDSFEFDFCERVNRIKSLAKYKFSCVVVLLFIPCASFAQISPGPLAKPHAQLEGLSKCLLCHEVGKQASNAKCLKCHVAIAERLKNQRGFHASIMKNEPEKSCASCHSDHNGKDFELIHWKNGQANFNHSQTGYVLEGQHSRVECRNCHLLAFIKEKFSVDQNVALRRTFLGLSQECSTCHADEHRGQLGKTCERCHELTGWKPAAKFSHDRAQFVLTGKHLRVACEKCHVEKPTREKIGKEAVAAFVQFTGLQFASCAPCHQDPHRGGFGKNCVKCHTTEGWQKIAGGSFNHDLTDFPLRGKHRGLTCTQCHIGGNYKKKIAHQSCSDCHQDAHAGQFSNRADRGRCESCHSVDGFAPSRFTMIEHQKTSFALTGSHLAVACGSCHVRETKGVFAGKLLFDFPDQRCQDCHDDLHEGQFDERIAKGGCESCHLTESWHKTTFDHNTARFALIGTHQKVACEKCHPRESVKSDAAGKPPEKNGRTKSHMQLSASASAKEFTRFRPLAFRCVDCHEDVHRGQFGKKDQVRCEKCHQSTMWAGLLFTHNRDSVFKLDGAHEKVACEKCHFALETKKQLAVVIYKPLRQECAACHR